MRPIKQIIKPEATTTLRIDGAEVRTVVMFALCRDGTMWAYCTGIDNGWIPLQTPPVEDDREEFTL